MWKTVRKIFRRDKGGISGAARGNSMQIARAAEFHEGYNLFTTGEQLGLCCVNFGIERSVRR